MVDAVFDGAAWRPRGQFAFYKLFGATSYRSIDLTDARADFAYNLNDPIPRMGTFDIITDFGTAEHVFNIGQLFASMHKLLNVGGILLFTSPCYGYINHGFFNLHPLLFFDVAAANRYEVVDVRYIDNMNVRCRAQEEHPEAPFDFDRLPIHPEKVHADKADDIARFMAEVALQFQRNITDPASLRLTKGQSCFPSMILDLCFAALRKTAASPKEFIMPFQSIFGAPPARQTLLARAGSYFANRGRGARESAG
jgi:SAM-dependent methyltransferase